MEWIDPRYAGLMKRFREVQARRAARGDDRPVRGFVLAQPKR